MNTSNTVDKAACPLYFGNDVHYKSDGNPYVGSKHVIALGDEDYSIEYGDWEEMDDFLLEAEMVCY